MRAAVIVIQKQTRGYLGRKHYRAMRTGYMRLQALIRSRILSHKFKHLRGHIIRLQVSPIYVVVYIANTIIIFSHNVYTFVYIFVYI